MTLSSEQQGRLKRAVEVLGQTHPKGLDTADLIHAISHENGQLRYWLADIVGLVGDLAHDAEISAAIAKTVRSAADAAAEMPHI